MSYRSQLYLAYDAVSAMLPVSIDSEGHHMRTPRLSNQAKLFLRMSSYFQKAAFNTRRPQYDKQEMARDVNKKNSPLTAHSLGPQA
jgi:hypothetical protein